MGTFAQMETRIIAELHRDDIATQVDDYINDAINHYARYRFWFNEKSKTFLTRTDSLDTYDSYALPDDFVTRGKRNQVRESFERHGLAGADEPADGITKRQQLTHRHARYGRRQRSASVESRASDYRPPCSLIARSGSDPTPHTDHAHPQ